ncbi:MAG TPA: DNA polymerase III subunit gamma/tau [Candidatus Saccharimonadales bacterium]|jgi:DNA polymerase-3 subunit gamma/tau|nr:DNA polymerase III subunit gamma/tau [Candidatus Saccharimonadales bacterium]
MGQALYRTYRSKNLDEIVGQEHITTALKHALEKGTISHAYLFTGPRGTGKTSIARILAHAINDLPYTDESVHLDIIEIDAASNRRIDEIRDLRDKVHIAPTSAKYKVYIIDEVHMLTREAFNALLKTLEEPPAHVVFILATTEVHKLPETIISRTQRYAFKPVKQDKVIAHLRHIAESEGIRIDDEALGLIAAHGEGSFRDSISLLDQVRNTDATVTMADIQGILGIAPAESIERMIAAMSQHDAIAMVEQLRHMKEQGYEPAQVARQLGTSLRQQLVAGTPPLDHAVLMHLLTRLIEVPGSTDPQTYLELSMLGATFAGVQAAAPAPAVAAAPTPPAPAPKSPKPTPKPASKPKETPKAAPAKPADEPIDSVAAPKSTAVLDAGSWARILDTLKTDYNTLHSVLKSAAVEFKPGRITLVFTHNFHRKRVHEAKNRQIIADVIKAITGYDMQIECTVGESTEASSTPTETPAAKPAVVAPAPTVAAPVTEASEPPTKNALDTISNIFGSAELLES